MSVLTAWLDGSLVLYGLAAVLGALFGSFLNVVIARLPEGESIVYPGSRCPSCKTPIPPFHNVPVLSWLWLRGRCASCKTTISARYPMVELLTSALFVACAARLGAAPALIGAWAFCCALVAVTFIDLDIWEIPDEIVVIGTPIACLARPWLFDVPWFSGLVGALLGASFLLLVRWVYFALRGIEAMGLGDVKLLMFIGAFLGPGALLPTITLASMGGVVVGVLLQLIHRSKPEASEAEPPEEETEDEAWARPPQRLRLGLVLTWGRRRLCLGVPRDMSGRTHVRVGGMFGFSPLRLRLVAGIFQDVPGWGHFEGLAVGHPPKLWFGPLLGARLPDVEVYGDPDDWEPPPTAVQFGPFLALGALATLLLGPALGPWARLLGI